MSFKTKSIVVRTQSVADHDVEMTDTALKNSMNRLKDLITDDQMTMVLHLSQIINSIAPILLDREYEVRKALIQFAKVLVKLAPAKLLLPFVTVVITYACSAMNHIVNEIRYDAVRFINIWIEVFPNSFLPASDQIIQNYMSLLSLKRQKVPGQDSFIKKSKDSAMDGDQIVVLSSLNQLLKMSTELSTKDSSKSAPFLLYFKRDIILKRNVDRWYHNSKWNLDIFATPLAALTNQQTTKPPPSINDRIELTLGETTVSAKSIQQKTWGPTDFVTAIVPACVDIWLEAATVVLSGTMINEGQGIEKLNLALSIVHQALVKNFVAAATLDAGERKAIVSSFSKHVLVSFPYGNNAVGIKTEYCEHILQEMNIKTCEIVSLFQVQDWAGGQAESKQWEETMFSYIFRIIEAKDDILPLQSMKMIFPLCESTLQSKTSKRGSKLMQLLVARHKELTPKSALWNEMFTFIEKAFMELNPIVNISSKNDWIGYLPKALWGLGGQNPKGSRAILSFLSEVLRKQSRLDVEGVKMVNSVQNGLVPFFQVVTPQKGPLFGPFLLLPLDCQKAAIELLYYLPVWSEKLVGGLAACLTSPTANVSIVSRAFEIAFERQNTLNIALDWSLFFGLVFTVGVVGSTSFVIENSKPQLSLVSYPELAQAFGESSSGDVRANSLGGIEKTDIVMMVRKRIYLSKMVAYLLQSNSELTQSGVLDFVMDVLSGFAMQFKSLDSYFGVCTLLSAVLSEETSTATSEYPFLAHLSTLCIDSFIMCLESSHENYELFKVYCETSLDVLKWFPSVTGAFKDRLTMEAQNMGFANRDRVKMVLDQLQKSQ
ncbi:UNVERIFIED_CONTAM: hypothetical protein HDU68_004196 [Siphonaria sp. JEL0065]|nr:hypothetical protein HDU68_004196 [Siphonaria sp. JEL0065]